MVCAKGSNQTSDLVVAPFDANALTIGAPSSVVSDRLLASPAFSPDGTTIAFLAPVDAGGQFQLWTVAASGTPEAKNITSKLGFDSASAPVWVTG